MQQIRGYVQERFREDGAIGVVEKAKAAFEANGVTPIISPIRGGTDGARLSYMGLPCPNLSTGGYNFHGRKEMITVEAMEAMVNVLESIVRNA